MENKKELSAKESLEIINNMILAAKSNVNRNAFYFLLWGWIVIIGSTLHYVFYKFTIIPKPHQAWLITIIGFIVSFIYGFKQSKKEKSYSHLGKIYGLVWLTFIISYFVFLIFIKDLNYQITALIFLMSGNSVFLSGAILKFRPLMVGAVFFWIGAIISFYLNFENRLLITPIIIIIGYLIPGYMLKRKEDNV